MKSFLSLVLSNVHILWSQVLDQVIMMGGWKRARGEAVTVNMLVYRQSSKVNFSSNVYKSLDNS